MLRSPNQGPAPDDIAVQNRYFKMWNKRLEQQKRLLTTEFESLKKENEELSNRREVLEKRHRELSAVNPKTVTELETGQEPAEQLTTNAGKRKRGH
jgi:hypothetical protein